MVFRGAGRSKNREGEGALLIDCLFLLLFFFMYLLNLGCMALLAPILPAPLVFLLAFLSDVVMHHSCSMYYKDLL